MLTDRFKNQIKFRLGVIKYAICSVLYWEYKVDKCVCSPPYIFYIWCTSYFSGVSAMPLLVSVVYFNILEKLEHSNDINDLQDVSTLYKDLGTTFTVLITLILLFCLLIVHILKDLKQDFCAFYNGCFRMDLALKGNFKTGDERRNQLLNAAMNTKECKIWEYALLLATICTLFPPILIFIFMFHPCDPLHRILVDLFEIEVIYSSPKVLFIAFVYAWSCFALCCTFVCAVYTVALTIASSCLWLNAIMPKRRVGGREYSFETEMMGQLDFKMITHIYRCHQLLCAHQNAIVANFEFCTHFVILHSTVILAAFILIKNASTFIDQGAIELLLIFGGFMVGAMMNGIDKSYQSELQDWEPLTEVEVRISSCIICCSSVGIELDNGDIFLEETRQRWLSVLCYNLGITCFSEDVTSICGECKALLKRLTELQDHNSSEEVAKILEQIERKVADWEVFQGGLKRPDAAEENQGSKLRKLILEGYRNKLLLKQMRRDQETLGIMSMNNASSFVPFPSAIDSGFEVAPPLDTPCRVLIKTEVYENLDEVSHSILDFSSFSNETSGEDWNVKEPSPVFLVPEEVNNGGDVGVPIITSVRTLAESFPEVSPASVSNKEPEVVAVDGGMKTNDDGIDYKQCQNHGRLYCDGIGMSHITNDQPDVEDFVKCDVCPFLIPIPKQGSGTFFEKVVTMLDMRKHVEKHHRKEFTAMKKSSQQSSPPSSTAEKGKKKNQVTPASKTRTKEVKKGRGRPPGSRKKPLIKGCDSTQSDSMKNLDFNTQVAERNIPSVCGNMNNAVNAPHSQVNIRTGLFGIGIEERIKYAGRKSRSSKNCSGSQRN
ncbi:unnamed protein product [Orchesella dallaii]|uniref:Uncharacterized protein n=1 Tax=Orchesella dallaii TaxID=48710 RepID=A0ABP1RME2_9HEXA